MYQREAQGLASLGRGPDTELVHMTPREVGALDSLARQNGLGGLPTNPQTGLPEAGIFDSIAPMLIGAAAVGLAPFTGGMSTLLANPLFLGGASALGAGIASGFDLSEMAKYGLGVAGGASLASGLMGAGAGTGAGAGAGGATAGGATTAGAGGATAQASKTMAEQSLAKTLAAEKALATNPATSAFGQAVQRGTANVGLNIGDMARPFTSLENLKTIPAAVGKAPIAAIGGSLAADQYSKMNEVPDFPEPKKSDFIYPEGGFMSPPRRSIDPFGFAPATAETSGERLFFDPSAFTSPGYIPAKEGGLLKGPGDGMSDEILLPITGAKNTIAAVSPDEFIVPADVVSGLGNGSSSAGAKQLYAMMDRVRDSRTGKTSQPREIKAKGMMPA